MKLASKWGDELATCRSLELQFVYNGANCKHSDCSLSIYVDKAKQKSQNRQCSGLPNDKAR